MKTEINEKYVFLADAIFAVTLLVIEISMRMNPSNQGKILFYPFTAQKSYEYWPLGVFLAIEGTLPYFITSI